MKIKKLILLINLLFLGILSIGAQELKNIEIQTMPLQDIKLSSYGFIVNYTTAELYKGTFYFPLSWFQAELAHKGEEPRRKVIGKRQFLLTNAHRTPLLKIKYVDGKLSVVTLILPGIYESEGIPQFRGSSEDIEALKEKFDRQESLDYLPFEEFQ